MPLSDEKLLHSHRYLVRRSAYGVRTVLIACALRTSAMCMPCAPFHPYQPVTGEKLDGDNHEVLLFQAHRSVIGESCGTHAGPALRQSLLLWYINGISEFLRGNLACTYLCYSCFNCRSRSVLNLHQDDTKKDKWKIVHSLNIS